MDITGTDEPKSQGFKDKQVVSPPPNATAAHVGIKKSREERRSRQTVETRKHSAGRRPDPSSNTTTDAPRDGADVTRHVPEWVKLLLWGRSAGRCQFSGCNRKLWASPVTQEQRNLAEHAHIRAFSCGGPRATSGWPPHLVNDLSNLMLVCHDCHVTIDRHDGAERYSIEKLRGMKAQHESRIELVTAIDSSRKSHVVTYGTYVGEHQALPTFHTARAALFPARYPAHTSMLELGSRSTPRRDRDQEFWESERQQLRYQFDRQIRTALEQGDVGHISVFALAPQPLLIELGSLLGDINDVDIYQLHREPKGWNWPEGGTSQSFEIRRPEAPASATPALVLSVSADVSLDRISRVLGEDIAVWMVTVPSPHNDICQSPGMLLEFRKRMRSLLNEIKALHGHRTPLHVFPAMPVSLAVELGRVRMPKAEPNWLLYDENHALGGFAHAFTISGGETT